MEEKNLWRVLSGIILASGAFFFAWRGIFYFQILCLMIGMMMLFEWLRMTGVRKTSTRIYVYSLLFLVSLGCIWGISKAFLVWFLGAGTILAYFFEFPHFRKILWLSGGIFYIGLSVLSLMSLRGMPGGFHMIIFLFLVVWANDTLAYYTGKRIGGPKLALSISPGKTYSGAAGGMAGALGAVFLLSVFFPGQESIEDMIVKGFFLAISAQIGDLVESWVKRCHNVKDSGNILPGHGGVLDRVDGLSAAGILLCFFMS